MSDAVPWEEVFGPHLRQGDLLTGCDVIVPDDTGGEVLTADVEKRDLIVVTQSCDLVNLRAPDPIALCPVLSKNAWETIQPALASDKKAWENVRKKRHLGIHLLPPLPDGSEIAADLKRIYALPFRYVVRHAVSLGARRGLNSPFREDFSHDFGAIYSRVAIPREGDPVRTAEVEKS